MSNKELEKLQQVLRKEIQTHQILVTKIKSDPHNAELRKSLHDQQAKITALSEKQKKVVEQLRSDLGVRKPSSQNEGKNAPTCTNTQPLTASQHLNIPNRNKPTLLVGSAPKLHQHTATPTLGSGGEKVGSGGSGGSSVGVPSGAGAGVGTGVGVGPHAPSTPTRMSILTNKPTVVSIKVPNISGRLTSMVVKRPATQNLSKELDYMAKQYKRQFLSTRPKDNPHPSSLGTSTASSSSSSTPATIFTSASSAPCKKPMTAEETKLEFMASIGLVTPKTAETLQSKRSERKRRSTANPQFSNYDKHELESRRSATSYLAAANGWSGERRRKAGRPARFADGIGSENIGVNGLAKQEPDGHEDICAVCRQIGELLMCDTCNLVYHLTCLDPPLSAVPPGVWSCPQFKRKDNPENWQGTLAVVHAFLTHKQAMEEEKKRLGRRAAELRMQRLQLEQKAKHLNEAITKQSQANESLMQSFHKTEGTITQLKDFLSSFQVKAESHAPTRSVTSTSQTKPGSQ
ncbi:PHD finger protein 21A-like [Diadema antillarum]|uniref:PHD finger protein 21A-like n=1 Tax=Diadema antillarum TaxID=105358 RepID=UPI003A85CEC9